MRASWSRWSARTSRSRRRRSSSSLKLRRPIYRKTAAYGHFGRINEPDFTWEATDKADALREQAGLKKEALAAK